MINRDKLNNWYNFQAPFYHFWRDRYDGPLVHKVATIINNSRSQTVLDAGCGTGLFTIGLAKLRKEDAFVGVDRSEGMLEIAKKQAQKLNLGKVSFHMGDVGALHFGDASFDAIIAGGLFCNIDEPSRILREFARVLKIGGKLIVVEFDRNSMTVSGRIFFSSMILGYKLFSNCFRRFRFADEWNINTSTLKEEEFKNAILGAGYEMPLVDTLENHLVLHCRKGA